MESFQNVSLFPKKPQRDPKAAGRQVKLFSNYYQLEFDQNDIKGVNKYTVKFEPEIPENSRPMRKAVLRKVKDKVNEKLEFFIDWGTNLYSLKKVSDIPELKADHDGTEYKVFVEWVQLMEATDKDHLNFLKIFFNSMMRSLKFEQIGPKAFNPAKCHTLDAHNVKVWPGFDTRMIMKERGALLSIDVAFKVVRTDSVLNQMNQLRDQADQKGKDYKAVIQDAIVGSTVVTRYNQKTYKIDRIEFDQSPESTFQKDGNAVSYMEYYKSRYNEGVTDVNQPLIINKDRKTGNEVALIPELCQLTGLTDQMRSDFRLQKDLAQIVHTNAEKKVKECAYLFQTFNENQKCQQKSKSWHIKFSDVPA